jgi:hypothetical protein
MPAWNKGVIGRADLGKSMYGAHHEEVDLPNKPDHSSRIALREKEEQLLEPSREVAERRRSRRKRSSLGQHALVGPRTSFSQYKAQDPLREPKTNQLNIVPRRLEPMVEKEVSAAEGLLAPPEKTSALGKYVEFRQKKRGAGAAESPEANTRTFSGNIATKSKKDQPKKDTNAMLAKRRARLLGEFGRKDALKANPFYSVPAKLNLGTAASRKSSWSRKLPTLKPDKKTNKLYLVFPKYGSIQGQNARYFSAASSLTHHGPGQ